MKGMMYRGYLAEIVVDLEARILHGRVPGIKDVITFQGDTVEEAERAFRESIDDYLAFCSERGEEPERPFCGKIHFRTTPELHRRITLAALRSGQSVNAFMNQALTEAANR